MCQAFDRIPRDENTSAVYVISGLLQWQLKCLFPAWTPLCSEAFPIILRSILIISMVLRCRIKRQYCSSGTIRLIVVDPMFVLHWAAITKNTVVTRLSVTTTPKISPGKPVNARRHRLIQAVRCYYCPNSSEIKCNRTDKTLKNDPGGWLGSEIHHDSVKVILCQ